VLSWSCLDGSWAGAIVLCVIGIILLFATLHVVRGLGTLHGAIAKGLLVPSAGREA
jgi:hypothetical protein